MLTRNFPVVIGCIAALGFSISPGKSDTKSLCESTEHVIFSCALKRPQKMVALCASRDLTKKTGYLQYRFGVPGKLELEYPKQQENSAQSFQYKHYFRAQVDLTEISFSNAGANYSVFSNYNGEQKPSIAEQGITVTPAGGGKDVTFLCSGRAMVDFGTLEDILHVIE